MRSRLDRIQIGRRQVEFGQGLFAVGVSPQISRAPFAPTWYPRIMKPRQICRFAGLFYARSNNATHSM